MYGEPQIYPFFPSPQKDQQCQQPRHRHERRGDERRKRPSLCRHVNGLRLQCQVIRVADARGKFETSQGSGIDRRQGRLRYPHRQHPRGAWQRRRLCRGERRPSGHSAASGRRCRSFFHSSRSRICHRPAAPGALSARWQGLFQSACDTRRSPRKTDGSVLPRFCLRVTAPIPNRHSPVVPTVGRRRCGSANPRRLRRSLSLDPVS